MFTSFSNTKVKIKNFRFLFLLAFTFMAGCQEDLLPSDKDNSTSQPELTQDFTVPTSIGDSYNLQDRLVEHDAVAIYFTMWCNVCDGHMSAIRNRFVDAYPNVDFVFSDIISNSPSSAFSEQRSMGYTDFVVLSDHEKVLKNQFSAVPGSTIVIDKNSIVQMHEDFRGGEKLKEVLDNL